jgi:hypothetical protein
MITMITLYDKSKLYIRKSYACDHTAAIFYNEYNHVVQCHECGLAMYGMTDTINVRQIL